MKKIVKISLKISTLKHTGYGSIATKNSVGNARYIAYIVKSKQRNFKEVYSEYARTAAFQRVRQMSKVFLSTKSNARDLPLVTLHKNFVKIRFALVGRSVVEVVSTTHTIISVASWSRQQVPVANETMIVACLTTLASGIDYSTQPRRHNPQYLRTV